MEYVYDDGSSISYDGTSVSSTLATDNGVYGWEQDRREAEKFGQFYGAGSGEPWWQQLAKYGATRAIDSHFQRAETNKTAQPITFAGQNGQTYAAGSTAPIFAGSGGVLLLAAAAAAAYLLLKG